VAGHRLAWRIKAELIWASGLAARAPVNSALIGFERVRPLSHEPFQPCADRDITPEALDRLLRALRRCAIDIVPIDEAIARLADPSSKPFVSLSVDGGFRDALTFAQPVFARHNAPFTVYVPSGFPDHIAQPWWLALEAIIRRNDRIILLKKNKQTFFTAAMIAAKKELYDRLYAWLRGLPPQEFAAGIGDLCTRYGVELAAPDRDGVISWQDVATLASDPLVTVASATVNYPVLTQIPAESARRDIAMGRAVLEAAIQRPVRHFAYPFGDEASFTDRHADMVEQAGFASAVTTIAGTVRPGRTQPFALPRLMMGNADAPRHLRVRLAGY
jgi:peptidoglycan/xylan/chitin deacetylase (PgdA/CDA1 family)